MHRYSTMQLNGDYVDEDDDGICVVLWIKQLSELYFTCNPPKIDFVV